MTESQLISVDVSQENKDKRYTPDDFDRIFHAYYGKLLAKALHMVNNIEDAEDIVQNVFINFYNHLATNPTIKTVSGYLYGALRNAVYDRYRKNKSLRTPVTVPKDIGDMWDLASSRTQQPEEIVLRREELEEVLQRIDTLTEEQRRAILGHAHGYSDRKIAKIAKTSEEAVKLARHRGRKHL